MSDETFTDAPDRASALDRFADLDRDEPPRNAIIPQQAFSLTGERIIGAQAVAVRRDSARVLSRLAALGAAAGGDWYYRFPVKNRRENRTDWIEGPSIKLANDLAREYGNCDVTPFVQDLGDSWLISARFTDFETGFSLVRPFQQRKSGSRLGGDDDARRLDIALQIGTSKAIRNVIVNALQTYADFAFSEAQRSFVNRIGQDLPRWRENTISRLAEHVELERVERVVGRAAGDWLAPDVAKVIAMMKAVRDGMASLDETFPPLTEDQPETGKPPPSAALDRFAAEASPPRKKRGRPTNAERAARAPEAKAQEAPPASAAEAGGEGPAAELELTGGDPAGLAKPPEPLSPLVVFDELVKACEQTTTAEEIDAIAKRMAPRITRLPINEDRFDLAAVGNAYAAWRRDEISEDELGNEVVARRKLISERAGLRSVGWQQ